MSFNYEGDRVATLDEVRPEVKKFLERQGATFDNVLANVKSDKLLKYFGLYSLPAVMVYDRESHLVKRFDTSSGEEFTYQDVERFLQGLF